MSSLDFGSVGKYETSSVYTYEGLDAKDPRLARIRLDQTFNYFPPPKAQKPFAITKTQFSFKGTKGIVFFDTVHKRVSNSKSVLKTEGKCVMDIGGRKNKLDLSQTQTTTITTTDDNPVKKPGR
jgi:hypothetical protein